MFSGLLRHETSFQAKQQNQSHGEITIEETSADTMEKILFFMYHNSIDKSKIDVDLLTAADKFRMEDLVDICVKHLKSDLTLKNALDADLKVEACHQSNFPTYGKRKFEFLCMDDLTSFFLLKNNYKEVSLRAKSLLL